MSPYASIDEGLERWAARHNYAIATEYKDCDVRTFFMATKSGAVQVWVEPKSDGRFDVVACNNRPGSARRIDRVGVIGTEVDSALDELMALVECWKAW
jgi:hypothetical protein